MKCKFKKALSICLAAILTASTMLVATLPADAAVDEGERYVPSTTDTRRYYFLMPDDWFNEYTSDAGVYWWEGTDACQSWQNMHKTQKGDCDNVFYIDCPKDVTVLIWTNMLDSGEFAKMSTNVPCGYYDPDESELYPDGIPEEVGFENMIWVSTDVYEVENDFTGLMQTIYDGDWYYYYGNGKYGTTPEEPSEEEYYYYETENGEIIITEYHGTDEILVIPSEIDGKKVTGIGGYAFSECESLKSVTIPDSVITIGSCAFEGCTSLESITIPDTVTNIGTDVFNGTKWYKNQPDGVVYTGKVAYKYKGEMAEKTSVSIKDGTKAIACGAFADCTNLESIAMPDSVTEIDVSAFYNCTSLTSVTIPDSVTTIGILAFARCTSLESITIPDSITSVGMLAFNDTKWYDNQPDGVIYVGKVVYEYKGEMPQNTSIAIKPGTSAIATEAFSGCTGLKSVTIPDSVTAIDTCAFSGCTSLESITIPGSVTSTGFAAFSSCTGLKSVTILNGVKYIGERSFLDCTSLENVTIPDSVTDIEDAAFFNCTSLKSVTIPAGVTNLGYITLGYNGVMFSDSLQKADGFTITGYSGSAAESYAEENGFEFISLGTTNEPEISGDVDGDGKINIKDVTAIQKAAASILSLSEVQMKFADVNADGKVNINDATAVQKYVAGIDTGLDIGK